MNNTEKPLDYQGLPEGNISLAAVSFSDINVINKLKSLNIKLIKIPSNKNIAEPVNSHADMLICHICGKKLFSAVDIVFDDFDVVYNKNLAEKYPFDIALNCLYVNGKLFCNQKYTDKNILNYCHENNIKIIDVKQGYTRCSTCVVDQNSVITADKGLYKIYIKNGLDVLLIEPGGIKLPGYDTGFIGGCSFLLSKNIIFFTGKILSHKNGNIIIDFIKKRNIDIVEADNEFLIDIGGAALLKEYV